MSNIKTENEHQKQTTNNIQKRLLSYGVQLIFYVVYISRMSMVR